MPASFLKKWGLLLSLIFISSSSFAVEKKNVSPQEALTLRRITEFWKDGDFSSAKKQILDFFVKHPESELRDPLNAMLGDLHFQEKEYGLAKQRYELIQRSEVKEKIFFNYLQTLFELKEYDRVAELVNSSASTNNFSGDQEIKARLLFAESLFRNGFETKDQEKKIELLTRARPQYEALLQTKYSDRALFPLAEIYRILHEEIKSAELYEMLAEKYPEHQEKFLFQAALMQLKERPELAIKNFSLIMDKGGRRAHLASFNLLTMLYQSGRYQDFFTVYDKVIESIPREKAHILRFYRAKAHYSLQEYAQAASLFKEVAEHSSIDDKETKPALLLLMNCCRHLKDLALLQEAISFYQTLYPSGEELPKALMIHAQIARDMKQNDLALQSLQNILNNFPTFEGREATFYDYCLLLYQTHQWAQTRDALMAFVEEFPTSERSISGWRHLINCCLEEQKEANVEPSLKSKEVFASILQTALNKEGVFNPVEKDSYNMILARCFFELGKFENATDILEKYLSSHFEDKQAAEAHLLMGLCLSQMGKEPSLFIEHGEKALALDPELPESEILHLELYNNYLAQSLKEKDPSLRNQIFDIAAQHLYLSRGWEEKTIKLDNYLWLANHYYKKAQNSANPDAIAMQRATTLFQTLLGTPPHFVMPSSEDTLFLEAECFKFSDLLSLRKEFDAQLALLKSLVTAQQANPALAWKFAKKAAVELALVYESFGNYGEAKKLYDYLLKTADNKQTRYTHLAQLRLSDIEYLSLSPEEKNLDNPQLISILHALKDLQIQKKLTNEPIHLEAGLRYAEMRVDLSDPATREESTLFFLKRMKDDFNATEDPIAKEYVRQRTEQVEQEKIFQSYMNYIEAKMLRTLALQEEKQNHNEKAQAYNEKALALVEDLLKDSQPLKPYLLSRVLLIKNEILQNE